MTITLKQNMLSIVGIMALCSLLGCVVLIHNAHRIGTNLKTETRRHIQSLIGKNAQRIESTMRLMEKNADDLATAGEAFYRICEKNQVDITDTIKSYLIHNFQKLPDAVGGGLWYEPLVMLNKPRYGLYAYREKDRVMFTWDLNTPAYDYHSQGWYRLAIPEKWDRSKHRPKRIYWTNPYMDEAATQALMITVDALMTDPTKGIIGMSTVDFSLEDLKKQVARMTVTPHSLPFAVDTSSGRLIAYPADPGKLMQPVSDLGWSRALTSLDSLTPGVVNEKSLTMDKDTFSLFYAATGTGITVGILSPEKELYASIHQLNQANLATSIAVIAVQVILFLLVALFMVRRVCNPITKLTDVAQQIADGDLQRSSTSLAALQGKGFKVRRDETGRLMNAFKEMGAKLNTLLSQVQAAGNQVAASSNEIATSSTHLEDTISHQATSADQVSTFSKQISGTVDSLTQTMNTVNEAASGTASLAETGQERLREMEGTMQEVLNGAVSISDKFQEIKENGEAISTIVTTITKVADQTNLLSLNAAIEAEKAGEYGMGFSVVASEIRRLADQTSVAVLDIEEMVNRMAASVTTGAAEMQAFSQGVGNAVKKISEMGTQLDDIMESVRTLTSRFHSVNQGMETQSQSANQISETIAELNTLSQNTLESIREFKLTAQFLNSAASDLQEEVSRFKLHDQA